MDCKHINNRRAHRLAPVALAAALLATGCQTVGTDENKIAASGIATEFKKMSMPPYVVEPPDILTIEVLQALPGRGREIAGDYLVRPDGTVQLGWYGDVYVAGLTLEDTKEKIVLHLRKYIKDEWLGLWVQDQNGDMVPVEPSKTDHVYVDVSEYNSKYYYVLGDVAVPGKINITGNEMVLDAINNAGGLLAFSAPANIRLVRPAPPGQCCPQLLPVNYPAIVNQGDSTTNYQMMPGDRLVVYRDPIVRTSQFIDKIAAPFFTVVNGVQSYVFAARNVKSINTPISGFNNQLGAGGRAFPPTTNSSR